MKDPKDIISKTVIEELRDLAGKVIAQHSFSYDTLEGARARVCTKNYYYSFDAFSLCFYDHNMSAQEFNIFGEFLSDYYIPSKEEKKQRIERASLRLYLGDMEHPWHNYRIEKRERPDFCLIGDDNSLIGVEVVGFTPEYMSVLTKIVDENYGKGKTLEQIKEDARKSHKSTYDRYVYYDHKGIRAVGTKTLDINNLKRKYAHELYKKYEKYKSMLSDFSSFVILADAQRRGSMGIDHECDADDVYKILEEMEPAIGNVTVAIIWQNAEDDQIIVKEYK